MLRHRAEGGIGESRAERRLLVDLKMQHLRDSRGRSDRQGHALGEDRGSRNTQMTGAELRQTGPGAARIDGDRLPVLRQNGEASVATDRSEERRVGKECVSKCRYRWSTYP